MQCIIFSLTILWLEFNYLLHSSRSVTVVNNLSVIGPQRNILICFSFYKIQILEKIFKIVLNSRI